MGKNLKAFAVAVILATFPTLLLWLPFILRLNSFWGIPLPTDGMATIVANYDGPLYLVVAKTFYNADQIRNFPLTLPIEYYAAHFPLFPLLIRLFAPLVGYPYSMLLVTITSCITAVFYFYKFIREFAPRQALFLTFAFSIFPARWLISHSVGSADPLFVATILASIYYVRRGEYLKAGIFGALAQLTKSAAILLFAAYFLYLVTRKMKSIVTGSFGTWVRSLEIIKTIPLFLIPVALISVFLLYERVYGNFLAYFNSGDNIHLFFPPFSIFNYQAPWVGTFWLEEIIFVYLLGAATVVKLIKDKEHLLAWFTGIFFISILFVSHRDLIRYALPMVPFAYAAFAKTLAQKEFKYILAVIIMPIYLFSLAFISQNVMQISYWVPFL